MWFAMAAGLWAISRTAGILAILFSTVWIGLARVRLGIHYPSDVLVGALLGWGCGQMALHLPLTGLTKPLLKFETRMPQLFYPMMFLISYEIANIFDDLRVILHGVHMV